MRDFSQLLPIVTEISDRAGILIMEHYRQEFEVRRKGDTSLVTDADEQAEDLILASLDEVTPDIPVISEEAVASGRQPKLDPDDPFWLVDPLDGTREFVSRNGEFTVNIALVFDRRPVLGVIVAPSVELGFRAAVGRPAQKRDGTDSWKKIRARNVPGTGAVAVSSRSHGRVEEVSAILGSSVPVQHRQMGSSLKFCLLAEGTADYYIRPGNTSEWDTAAGQAILTAAGGTVRTLDEQDPFSGDILSYGKADWLNPGFVACGPQ